MKLNSIYVSAVDFNRAKTWYSKVLLNRKPDMETDRFSFWKLGDVYFGVFNPQITSEKIEYGNNCVPNIEVPDVDQLYAQLKAKGVEIIMELNNVGGTRVFQCLDSENNVLEFYQWLNQ